MTTKPREHGDSDEPLDDSHAPTPTAPESKAESKAESNIKDEVAFTRSEVSEITSPRELSPEQAQTLTTLKANFDKHASKFPEIQWSEVEAKLNKEPSKLDTLQKLIKRGGEPTVTEESYDGNFRFDELSPESPKGPRNVNWKQAFEYAEGLGEGVQLMDKHVYNSFAPKGLTLDVETWSWLNDDPKNMSPTHCAPCGSVGIVREGDARTSTSRRGLRCSVNV